MKKLSKIVGSVLALPVTAPIEAGKQATKAVADLLYGKEKK
jgi:hypothetical protein